MKIKGKNADAWPRLQSQHHVRAAVRRQAECHRVSGSGVETSVTETERWPARDSHPPKTTLRKNTSARNNTAGPV